MNDERIDTEDIALVARCLRGDGDAWAALVRRYQRLVYAVVLATGMDQHAAADVFQTVFERLLGHLARIDEPGRLRAWIVTTAKREALLQRRRGTRTVSMTQDDDGGDREPAEWDIPDGSPLPDQVLSDLQDRHRVRLALDGLDERCRDLLTQLFADEPPAYEVLGQRLGIPVGSIGPTRQRCLDKLRRLLS